MAYVHGRDVMSLKLMTNSDIFIRDLIVKYFTSFFGKLFCATTEMNQTFNSLVPDNVIWHQRTWVKIGSGNSLLPDGTKPLSEPVFSVINVAMIVST